LKIEKEKFVKALASIEMLETGAAASMSMSSTASVGITESPTQRIEIMDSNGAMEEDEV
jgi:hypothetical protein